MKVVVDKSLLDRIEVVLHKADWCAGKLDVSMKRFEVSRRMEFETLVDYLPEIREIRTDIRAILENQKHEQN